MTFWASRTSTSEYDALLPFTRRGFVCSPGSWLGRRFLVGGAWGWAFSPGFGGSMNPYAQSGSCSKLIDATLTPELSGARGSASGRAPAWTGGRAAGRRDSYTRCATMPRTKHRTPTRATPARPTRCFTDASSTSLQDDVIYR